MTAQDHVAAKGYREVLEFWFAETTVSKWYVRDEIFDDEVRVRLGALSASARAGELASWEGAAEAALALLILLDQVPRNIFRGQAEAFAGDALARAVARRAIEAGFDQTVAPLRRSFFYLPFEHSESLADQDFSLELFKAMGNEIGIDYAERHHAIIARFGRFPHRNLALGRASTPEEEVFLTEPGSSF